MAAMAFWINIYGCQLYPRHGHLSVNQLKAIVRDCITLKEKTVTIPDIIHTGSFVLQYPKWFFHAKENMLFITFKGWVVIQASGDC